MKKQITKKGYRVLAIVWTIAAASMAVAFVRRLAEFNLLLLLLLVLSLLTASNFWRAYRRTPEEDGPHGAPAAGRSPPQGDGLNDVLRSGGLNNVFPDDDDNYDWEEKNHE